MAGVPSVPTLYKSCLQFVSWNSRLYNELLISELPSVVLDGLLSYWSAYDLNRFEGIYRNHGISTTIAWKNHIKARPECFRNNPGAFQTEYSYENPKERYLGKHFQDILAYLTYDGTDPNIPFYTCLDQLWKQRFQAGGQKLTSKTTHRKPVTTVEEALKITAYVKCLTLFGKQFQFLLEEPKLLCKLGSCLQRLVIHIARDSMFPAITLVVENLLKYRKLEHVSLFHSVLSQKNIRELLRLCSGQKVPQSYKRNLISDISDMSCQSSSKEQIQDSYSLALPKSQTSNLLTHHCQCPRCVCNSLPSTSISPENKLYCNFLDVNSSNYSEICDKTTNVNEAACSEVSRSVSSSLEHCDSECEIDLFNEAVGPLSNPVSSQRRLFTSSNPTSVRSLSVISSSYLAVDLESVLAEVLSGWYNLQKFAIQFTWMQKKKASMNGGLIKVLKDMISIGQLSELVIEETHIFDNGASPLEVLEAVMHGKKRTIPMKALKLKDLFHCGNSYNFVPTVPYSGINYHGIVHLDLAKNLLSGCCFTALLYILRHDLSLQHLGIAGCGLAEAEVIQLFDVITENCRLVTLDISDQSLGETTMWKLNNLLKKTTSLKKLIMVYCQLYSVLEQVPPAEFSDAIAQSNLTSIVLSQNRLGRKGIDMIISILKQQTPSFRLTDIDISYNTISLAHLTEFANYLKDLVQRRPKNVLSSLSVTGNIGLEVPIGTIYRMFYGVAADLHAENVDFSVLHADHISQM